MLVMFQSPAAPDVILLRDLAQYLPGLAGKRFDTRGVILHDELPGVISRLEAAISDEPKAEVALEALNYSSGCIGEPGSGFSQRAWLFLDMMREARKQNADIIWGVRRPVAVLSDASGTDSEIRRPHPMVKGAPGCFVC